MHRSINLSIALSVLLGLLAWSGWQPYDRATWLMEVFPIFIFAPLLVATYARFPLTNLLYICAFIHAVILLVGGAYTYARVPLGFQISVHHNA
jgi:putative membrane protein